MANLFKRFRPYAFITPALGWLLIFFVLPLFFVLYFSFLQKGAYGAIIYEFSLQNYIRVFDPIYRRVFYRSVILAGVTIVFCMILAYPLAYWLAFYTDRARQFLLFMFVVPTWTSYLVRIYGWMFLLRDTGLINNFMIQMGLIEQPISLLYNHFAVALGISYSYITFMLLPLYSSLTNLDQSVLEAAYDLGANPFERFFRVTLPMTSGGLMAGTILVGVPALGEFIVPQLLGGAKVNLIANLIESRFIDTFDWPLGSAMAIILAIVVITGVLIYMRISRKGALERIV